MSDLKHMMECAHNYENFIDDIKTFYDNRATEEKHKNGFIYDSLVYRYQVARYMALEMEIPMIMNRLNCSRQEAKSKALKIAQRDIVRFCEILDEGMKDHD